MTVLRIKSVWISDYTLWIVKAIKMYMHRKYNKIIIHVGVYKLNGVSISKPDMYIRNLQIIKLLTHKIIQTVY